MIFFDSHCHLDLLSKKLELIQVLSQCEKNQVKRILMPGISKNNWTELKKLKNKYSDTHCRLDYAFGLHPYFINEHIIDADLFALETAIQQDDTCIAVGEIGLDNFVAKQQGNAKQQAALFIEQLKLAQHHRMPIIIHHRKSIDTICQIIRAHHFEYGGVVHAFSGSIEQAYRLIELGFKLGIGGTITYSRATKTREVVRKLDSSHFLLETDAPDMPICGRQGQSNSPAFLPEIFEVMAQLKSTDKSQLSQILWQNTFDCFPRLS